MNRKGFFIILFLLNLFLFIKAQDDFLGDQFVVEPDIKPQVNYEEGIIVFNFFVDEDYHITDLKNNFFEIELEENKFIKIINIKFPEGVPYKNENVFKGEFRVNVYVKSLKKFKSPYKLVFNIGYQICKERPMELCFAPESKKIEVNVSKRFEDIKLKNEQKADKSNVKEDESYSKWMNRIIKEELRGKPSLLLFVIVFISGFLTSLTPCVYPVIPIVMGYIGSRAGKKKIKGFYLSLFFVLGLSIVYAILGVIAATTGSLMGISFQNPVVVLIISFIFIVMGLSLAGFFEIPVPSSISSKIQKGHKSEILGSIIIGGVSGIIAAPCVGPVLIALLSWISQTKNLFLGFWLTFTFSLGMSVIFVLAGTFSGVISSMPKAGKWMDYMKYLFSILLIGGGIYFLSLISSKWVTLLMWGIFLISVSIFTGLFKGIDKYDYKEKFYKVIVVIIFLCGVFLFFKSIEIKYFPYSVGPVENYENNLAWIGDLEQGKLKAEKENKILIVDAYAEWCVACKELDKYTFSEKDVSKVLKDYVIVKLDFTEKSEKNRELRKRLNIIGMPTVLFLNAQGMEIKRFSGFKNKDEFLRILNNL